MQPMPETDEALDEFVGHDDRDLRQRLLDMGRRSVSIVPSCVGISLMLAQEGVTLTLIATSEEVAMIDAAQYLDGGPCIAAAADDDIVSADVSDLMDEDKWSLYARTSAAEGVLSSLSLPISQAGRVVGSVNLYAAVPNAFLGHHAALAAALGASAEAAVADADLGFSTRTAARRAPATMAEIREVDVAVGTLAARHGEGVDAARRVLEDAAKRARVSVVQAARVVLGLRRT